MSIVVGTCGYRWYDPGEGWKDEYERKLAAFADAYPAVELNSAFYDLPQVSTTERWRREAGDGFVFTMKAWQALTHEWSSPTWNNNRDAIPEEKTDDVGSLEPNDTVRDAWDETLARANALEADVVLIQCPPSFDATDEHESNIRDLLGSVERDGVSIAWEPRGTWKDDRERVESVCADLDLIHVVDPMRDEPVGVHDDAYLRLHGLNEDPYDYDYDYTSEELDELTSIVRDLDEEHDSVYCLFNNEAKFENADALMERLDQ